MAGSAWDAIRACCVDIPASLPLQSFEEASAAIDTGYLAVDTYLMAVRQLGASSEISRFNGLMLNSDYRRRFLEGYPEGRVEGFFGAIDEIKTQLDEVFQSLYAAAEALANDPKLQDDVVAGGIALFLRPAANLSDSQNTALDARLDQVQRRLRPGFASAPDVGTLPLSGMRQSTRRVMQAVSSLQIWRNAIVAPEKLSLGAAAVDAVFQSSQDWSDVFVGAEEDLESLFSMTTEALVQMNCDPAAQGYNLGWVTGYMAFWVATTVVFEAALALETPL